MNHFLNTLELRNFKSIENLRLETTKVNMFIGEPNVGKSNILEALGLISALGHHKIIRDFIRLKEVVNLFFKESLTREIEIILEFASSEKLEVRIKHSEMSEYEISINDVFKGEMRDHKVKWDLTSKRELEDYGVSSGTIGGRYWNESYQSIQEDNMAKQVKYYKFRDFNPRVYKYEVPRHEIIPMNEKERIELRAEYNKQQKMSKTLEPPDGKNIFNVIKNTEDSREAFRDLLDDFGLKLLINTTSDEIQLIKEEDQIFFTLPLYSLADTLQSVFFYTTAILSNKNKILVFEEPESHTFPFYTKSMGELIAEDKSNQFFIATHSPYFLDAIFSKVNSTDLQINLVKQENNQTKIHQLNEKQVATLFEDDIFTAVSHFDDWPME